MDRKSWTQFQRLAENIQQNLSGTTLESVCRVLEQYERNWATTIAQASEIGINVGSALSADQRRLERAFAVRESVAADYSKLMAAANSAVLALDTSGFRASIDAAQLLQESMADTLAQVQSILDDVKMVDWPALNRNLSGLLSALNDMEIADSSDEALSENEFDETDGVVLVSVNVSGEGSFQAAGPMTRGLTLRLSIIQIHLLWATLVFLPSIIVQNVPEGQDWFDSPAGQTFMDLWIPAWVLYREKFKSYLEQYMDDE